jgi:hypothetical protein
MSEYAFLHPLLAEATSTPAWEIVLKILGSLVGLFGLGFGVYMALLNRKMRQERDREKAKEKNLQLTIDQKIEGLRAALKEELTKLAADAGTVVLRLTQIEQALGSAADTSSMASLKYTVESDLTELKNVMSRFTEACGQRHEKLAAHGSLADLKARVDGAMRKISSLEDFRHNSADRYVLMVNYQQDIKMVTDAIGMLREDLRAVIDLVDNLA